MWITPRAQLTASLSNIPCPDCRPTPTDKEELRLHHLRKKEKITLPGLEAAKKYTASNRRYYALSIASIIGHLIVSVIKTSASRASPQAPT